MADNEKKTQNPLVENLAVLTTPENIQKYFFGTKKNGAPRAVYDIVRDYTKPKKKKKKHKKKDLSPSTYDFYVSAKKRKKKHKKKKNKNFWHI